jgi:membrane protein DedA with SNARE-associated domain
MAHLLPLASITDPLVRFATNVIGDLGLAGVFVLMLLESACIPIPSEVTMVFAGFLVSQGKMGFWEAILAGTAGNLVGSWIAWGVGAYGIDAALLRYGHYRRHLELAHRWFDRYGTPVVFFSRLLPVVRTFISLPAGVARMPLPRFSALTAAGSLLWCILLVAVGDAAGASWDRYQHRFHYLDYVVIVLLLAALAWWLMARRRRRRTA